MNTEMKRALLEAHCPLCHEPMYNDDDICDRCDEWGAKNNIDLRERLNDDEL